MKNQEDTGVQPPDRQVGVPFFAMVENLQLKVKAEAKGDE